MSPVFVQDADGCVVPAVVDSDGTPTEAFTAAVRKHRRPRVNLPDGPDGPGVKDGKYTYHDPGTGRFAPYGFITPSKLKALLNPDARKRKEVLGELQDKLDDNDPLLAEYVRALRQGDKNRARQIAAAIRRAVIGDRPAAGDDRNAWDAGSREVAKLIPAAAKRADARGVHASNVPRNQIGMNPRVEAEAAAKERLAEMRNGGSLSVGRKVDFDEPEDAVDVNRPTAPGKVTAADVQPGDTVDGLRNVKGAHKVDTIRPDDSGAGYFIRLDGENEERFVHRDRLLTVTSGDRTETPEPDRAAEPLTPDQRAALEWYSGQGFGEINGRLRSGDDESDAETIATIDSAMAPLPQMTVNRTFTSEDALGDPDALLGKTLTDDAYMSTAKGGRTGGLAPLAVEIDVPEGTLGRDISDLSENPHEGEVLLGRGARLEITGVERNEFGLVRLKARVVTDATGESGPDVGVDTPEVDPQIGRFRLADWEAIQPWKVERDPANPDPSALLLNGEPAPTWLKFSSALGTEAASHTDQAILLKPAFFALPTEESKRSALYHEAGHGLSDRMLEDQSAFDLVDDLPDFGHLNGQSTPGEVAAEAFSILWSEPSYLDEHAPGIRDAIIRKASEYGYPLPAGVRGTEPEPVDLIDTVEEQGGFTLDPRLGELVTRGIAVAVPGESAIIKADRFREDGEAERFIGDYIRKMRDDGLGDDVMIGAWYDREHDEIVLDRVQVFPDDQREEAIQAGRDRNEQAVYDLTNSNEIPTGGSGGREDINIIGGSDGDRTSEAVEGPDGRRDRPDDVPPGFQPATPDEVRDAARLNGTVRARVGNQGRMRRFAVGDEIEARYRDDEFADVWATTPEGKRRKYRVRWDRLDAFTDTDTSGARYGTSEQVKDAAAATDGPISARIADGRLHHLGLNAGDTIQVEYLNPHHGIVHVPTRDGGVRKYKVRWDRLDAHGGTAEQATPTAPEPRTPKKKSGPASQANRDAKKARLTALAEENGYSYEEIRDAERQVGQIKEAIRAEAKAAAYDALGQLELLGGSKLKRVAPKRQVTDARTGRKVWKRDAASEWDWYDDLDAFEDRRLRSRWMVDGDDTTGGMNPDELAGWAFNAGLTPDDSIESGIGWYLEVTARIDAAESLGRGRLAPGTDRVNLNDIAPTTTGDARLDVTDLFGPQSIDDQILAVAAASRDTDANRGLDEESGYAMLGDTVHLPPDEQPWTFTRDEWGAEGDRLVAAATAPDATDDDLAALKNHIPQGILDITTDDDDWGELYDWLEAAATAAGYDNVGTRGAAAPEPDAPTAPDVPEPTPADLTDGSFADALDRQRDRYAGGEWGPLSWYDTPDGRPVDREARARRLAEKLRGSYRGSVSDADVRRTHRAVAEAFPDRNLDASTLDEIDDASGGARTTGGLLVDDRYRDDVMRALYDETQRFLVDDLGLDPDGYITVVRGIAGEQGREWVEAGRPSRISAPPLTSFTTDPSQAAGYGGSRFSSASAPDASVVKVRVPVRDVVSAGGGFAGSPTEIVAMGADGGFDVVGYRSGGRGSESDEWLIPGDATPPTPEPTPDAPEVEPTLGGPVGERVGYADWQTTQPWNATLEQVEAGEIPWIVHNPGMSDWIAARWHDGRMEVPTRFFEGTDNELLVHHEVGHSVQKALFAELGDVAPLLAPFSNGTGFRSPFGGSDDPASHDNQPAEIVADAFAHLSTGTAGNFTGPGTDELFDAVATKAAEMGFDLPSRHQRQAHHDWKQLPDGRWRRTPSDGNQVQVTEDGEAFRWTSFHLAADGTEKLDSGTAGSLTDAQSAADAALAVRQSADIIEEAPDAPEPDATPVDVPETVQGLLDDLKASHSNVTVELNERGDGDEKYLTLDKIASLDRSKGEGSVVLDKILDYADRTGQPVFLTPEAGIKGGKTRLTNWYKGRGFVPNKGRRKDFRSRETMVRQPSPIESTGTEVPDAPAEPGVPGGAPYPIVPQVIPEAAAAQRASAERDLTDGDVAEMEQTIADAPQKLRVRVPSETLASLLSDGRWRTQYETGTTRGADDLDGPRGRRAGERERFGAPIDLPDADRPVYGIVDDGPITMRESQKYGEVVFHVKPEAAGRTSVTFGDSLAGSGGSIPLGQDGDPDVLGAWSGAWQRGRYADQPIGGIGYTEAQFHGGLTLDDIESTAEFHYDPSVRSEAHVERAARALTKQGMTLAVRPAERPNNGSDYDMWDAEVGAEVDQIVADLQAKGLNVERLDSPASAEVSAPDTPEPDAPDVPTRTITPDEAVTVFGDAIPGPGATSKERLRGGFLDGTAFSPEFRSALDPDGTASESELRDRYVDVTNALREDWAGQLSQSANTRRFQRRVAELFADRNLDTAAVDAGEATHERLKATNPIFAAEIDKPIAADLYFTPDQYPDLGGIDGLIREQYDATQRWLADKGIGPDDDIEFYRGITGQQYDDWVAAGRPANIGSAPVAAVTADRDLADEYGPAEGGVTLKMTVKGRDVIAADSGSALPGEVLVLGTDGQMTVTGWSENRNGTFTPIGGFGERTPADFTDIAPDGKLYRATTADRTYPADGLPGAVYYSGDRSYVENYGDQVTEVDLPDDALDIRKDEDRTAMRDWMQTKLTDLQRTMVDGQAADGRAASGYVQDAHEALREDSPAATGRALANVGLAMNAVEGSDAFRSGTAQKAMLDDLGHSAMIDQEADGGYSVAFAEPPAPVENGGGTGAPSTVVA